MKRSRHPLVLSIFFVSLLASGASLGGSAVGAGAASHAGLVGTISFESASGLFSLDLANRQVRRIPGTAAGDRDPVWSPDGKRLLFDREQDHNGTADDNSPRDIYVMNTDGSHLRRLTSNPGDDGWAKWSPDGRSIVFESKRPDPFHTSVYAMNVRTGTARYVADGFFPSWRTDHRILFTNVYGEILTVRPYGSELEMLPNQAGLNTQVQSVVPSPNGTMIAYVADSGETDSYGALYTARSDGSSAKLVVAGAGEAEDPAWSPDGSWIAYDYRSANAASDLYVIHPDGTGEQQLTHTGEAYSPNWRTEPK